MQPRILIADNEPWAVELLSTAATRLGAEVFVAANGIEAIERFKRDAPDLVVLDSLLAKINGVETAARIRATAAGRVVPVVMSSALYRRDSSRKLQRKAMLSELLEKPFDASSALETLSRWMPAEDVDAVPDGGAPAPLLALSAAGRELDGRHLGALLLDQLRERRTGVLQLDRGGSWREVALERGVVIHARSNLPTDRIDRVLARVGRITVEQQIQLEQALATAPGRIDLVPTLVRLGWLWTEEVRGAIHAQMAHILLHTVLATRGRLRFVEGPLPVGLGDQDLRAPEMAFWALRRFDGLGGFRDSLPPPRSYVARADSAEKIRTTLNLTSIEEQIVGLADGRRRLGDLLSIARFGPVDVARVLHALLAMGVLVARPEHEPAALPAEGRPPLALTGELALGSCIELFARLWLEDESGLLRLERGDAWREIVLDGGEAVWADSSDADHGLAAMLRETGEVTEQDLREVLRLETESTGRRIGGILLERKALTLEELDRVRRMQIQRIIMDALSWSSGSYAFRPQAVAGADRVTLSMGTPDLVIEAARRNPAPGPVAQLLLTPDTVLMKAWDSDQIERSLRLERGERLLLDVLETGRPAVEVRGLELLLPEELARVLHALLALEVVRAARGRVAESEEPTEGDWQPAELLRDLLEDGILPQSEGAETSGVVQLGGRARPLGPGNENGARLGALRSENDELRRRIAHLEAELARRQRE